MRSRSKMTGNGLAGESGSAEPSAEAGPAVRAPADLEAREDTAEPGGPGPARQPGSSSRRALKNWRVRSRLVLLIAIPTLTAVVLGGAGILSYARSATALGRVQQLAEVGPQLGVDLGVRKGVRADGRGQQGHGPQKGEGK